MRAVPGSRDVRARWRRRPSRGQWWLLLVAAAAAIPGCAGHRIVDGVFHSPKGYRVALPPGDWHVARQTRADLELRHGTVPAGMAVNATCEPRATAAPPDVLVRHLLIGLRDRSVLTADEISLNGQVARHAIVDGRLGDSGQPVRVEYYVVQGERCVYDLFYAAPPGSFEVWRPGFRRLVETFRME